MRVAGVNVASNLRYTEKEGFDLNVIITALRDVIDRFFHSIRIHSFLLHIYSRVSFCKKIACKKVSFFFIFYITDHELDKSHEEINSTIRIFNENLRVQHANTLLQKLQSKFAKNVNIAINF